MDEAVRGQQERRCRSAYVMSCGREGGAGAGTRQDGRRGEKKADRLKGRGEKRQTDADADTHVGVLCPRDEGGLVVAVVVRQLGVERGAVVCDGGEEEEDGWAGAGGRPTGRSNANLRMRRACRWASMKLRACVSRARRPARKRCPTVRCSWCVCVFLCACSSIPVRMFLYSHVHVRTCGRRLYYTEH